MALYVTLGDLKYYLNTAKVDLIQNSVSLSFEDFAFAFLLKFYLINYLQILHFPLTQLWKQ